MAGAPAFSPEDDAHMAAALALARRGLGQVAPNPAVGCVLVRDGRVVGRGWTQPGGRPHAETEALRRAGAAARGATAYVTLEPCCHHGRTGPCAGALIEAGIARVVVALRDPDPRVDGGGFAMLRAAGIRVDFGLREAEAAELNAGFLSRIRRGRPLLTLKCATTLDGRIALRSGESRWVTGAESRAAGHALRATHDVILVGLGTVLADDPELTCRLPGLEGRSPIRAVADSRLGLPLTAKLARGARQVPTWLLCVEAGADRRRIDALAECGVEVIQLGRDADGKLDLAEGLAAMGGRGVTRVLLEGGGRLAAAALRAGLVDRLEWFRAARLIGGDGIPAVAALGLERMDDVPGFVRTGVRRLGADLHESYRLAEPV
ncbi:MAG TPA: bifunctional diaminohydroxyphosphoribosylaminopyrimidine deaminase/5-amino-6-(5-phosphoribosylamino)uracil reductase RibD [Alphaproteobacteria bacterium]|nr:bifunctional diaminohydroxyphosphoribosylaminopyrimidine deaminase/5-amino-6-(5-phosphoribosylamino)uracil reductase RibD [Alphaproteobacteria bacterium]